MHRRQFISALAALGAAGIARANENARTILAQATSAPTRRNPDVVFVPTPEEVINKMLEVAKVTPKDVVYDLGCGDGRIVVAAAKKGARAVGIDIDPQRIKEANARAQAEKVTDKARFIENDLFEADISEATVVTLYLLPRLNEKLKPKLLKELKPGTRIVSHAFDMGDWAPEQKVSVGSSTVYLWRVPKKS
ncbi:MAG TPA: class I SAM-dependent methyltransferase [Burkholderiales bacterium]|nr:class I SAM-dependent methyltransferase [Burkholderiales bacterium]